MIHCTYLIFNYQIQNLIKIVSTMHAYIIIVGNHKNKNKCTLYSYTYHYVYRYILCLKYKIIHTHIKTNLPKLIYEVFMCCDWWSSPFVVQNNLQFNYFYPCFSHHISGMSIVITYYIGCILRISVLKIKFFNSTFIANINPNVFQQVL